MVSVSQGNVIIFRFWVHLKQSVIFEMFLPVQYVLLGEWKQLSIWIFLDLSRSLTDKEDEGQFEVPLRV